MVAPAAYQVSGKRLFHNGAERCIGAAPRPECLVHRNRIEKRLRQRTRSYSCALKSNLTRSSKRGQRWPQAWRIGYGRFRNRSIEGGAMKPRQAFGVVVRAFGLFVILYGIYGGSYTVAHLLGVGRSAIPAEFIFSVFFLLLGLALILGAEWVVRLAYGRDQDSN